MILSRGSLTAPLACALFQQETTVRAQIPGIVARTRFFLENCSILFPFHIFGKFARKNGKGKCQEHIVGDLTRPVRRPGEFIIS